MHDLLYADIRNTPISRKSSFMMTQSQFLEKLKSYPGRGAPILRHESRNEEK